MYYYFESLEQRRFYIYTALFLTLLIGCATLIVIQYYSTVDYYTRQLNEINMLREEAQTVQEKYVQVQNQREAVDKILAEEPDFKIGGYFNQLLASLNIENKSTNITLTQIDREDNYRESELTVQFINFTMKELTLLLHAIEQKKRIYIKRLEITKSASNHNTIEVTLTIATLLLKTE